MEEGNTVTPAGPMGLGGASSVLMGGVVLVLLLFVLMFTAKKLGEDGEFKNIKVSFYNALVIGLAAIVAIPLFKFAFSRIPVPGLSPWIASV